MTAAVQSQSKFRVACASRGCKAKSQHVGWPEGKRQVCRDCAKCVDHCAHDAWVPATSQIDIDVAVETVEQEESGLR